MPLQIPKIDDRRFQELLDEALARVPIHNPEWTNFNRSDPGVTLIEVFAFMTESLLYRANLIPERNRLKFLQLLGVPLNPAESARGIVTFYNERGLNQTVALQTGVEVAAGQIPFRTERGLDVLPIEGKVYFKRPLVNQESEIVDYYNQLYSSFHIDSTQTAAELTLYETAVLDGSDEKGISLAEDTIDNSVWIALLAKENANPAEVRKEIATKTLSLGIVPALDDTTFILPAGGQEANKEVSSWLSYQIPKLTDDKKLPENPIDRVPQYRALDAVATADVLKEPGTIEITLPVENDLFLWENLEPLELGADDFPPTLEDSKLNERLITWIRITGNETAVNVRFLWVGINSAMISQRTRVTNEVLSDGTGEPDQTAKLARVPLVPKSLKMFVTNGNVTEEWFETDDLLAAGSEVSAPDLRRPPGAKKTNLNNPKVFSVSAEAGLIHFGDGVHGQRPPLGSRISVSYDFGAGIAGNVGADNVNTAPSLASGIKVTNPVRTWGGADAENVVDGEKQVSRFLQHRERLVTVSDFEKIVMRTPGVLIGRVEIIPTFIPELSPNEPGDAAGAVTIMAIPRYDSRQPDAPVSDHLFLDTICRFVNERRLITTEIFLRGPIYTQIWISVGINITADRSAAEVREAVKQDLLRFLSPLNPATFGMFNENNLEINKGWRLRKPITAKELSAVASRTSGVMFVNDLLLSAGTTVPGEQVSMVGLELPRVIGISVSVGDALPLSNLLGAPTGTDGTGGAGQPTRKIVPVPVIPEEC